MMKLDEETKDKLDVVVTETVAKGEYRRERILQAARSALPHVVNLGDRMLDKALQRLRKKGVIKYESRSGWSAVVAKSAEGSVA